jgi:hypothetical protein
VAQGTPLSRQLQLQFVAGTDSQGRPKVKKHNFAHVLPTASDDDVLAIGQALANLSNDTLFQIARVDQTSVTP